MRKFPRSLVLPIVLGLLSGGALVTAGPRTAIVNIQEIFREYHKSVAAQNDINDERARIQKENNDIQQRLRSMEKTVKALRRRLRDPVESEGRSEEDTRMMQRELVMRIQEGDSLERARKAQIEARHGELNRRMVVRMQAILEEIRQSVAEAGRRAGYDYVFDMEGLNTSQVPSVLYAKDATDITAIILKELNKNAPQER